jgi:hypothetical protein
MVVGQPQEVDPDLLRVAIDAAQEVAREFGGEFPPARAGVEPAVGGLLDDVQHAHRQVGGRPGLDGQADMRGGAVCNDGLRIATVETYRRR